MRVASRVSTCIHVHRPSPASPALGNRLSFVLRGGDEPRIPISVQDSRWEVLLGGKDPEGTRFVFRKRTPTTSDRSRPDETRAWEEARASSLLPLVPGTVSESGEEGTYVGGSHRERRSASMSSLRIPSIREGERRSRTAKDRIAFENGCKTQDHAVKRKKKEAGRSTSFLPLPFPPPVREHSPTRAHRGGTDSSVRIGNGREEARVWTSHRRGAKGERKTFLRGTDRGIRWERGDRSLAEGGRCGKGEEVGFHPCS